MQKITLKSGIQIPAIDNFTDITTSDYIFEYYINKINKIYNNEIIDKELEEIFSPEFRNRFSAIIRFNHLNENTIFKIIDKEMEIIRSSFKKKRIDFEIDNSVNAFVLKNGYNKSMGARPIERFINEKIKIKLANLFLENEINKTANNEKISIHVKDDEIVVN